MPNGYTVQIHCRRTISKSLRLAKTCTESTVHITSLGGTRLVGPVQFVVVRNHRQPRTFYHLHHLPSIQTIRVASLKVPFITLLKFCVNALEVIEVALE